MHKVAFAVHGGAGKSSHFLKKNIKDYKAGLGEAALAGYEILKKGGSAVDAVEKGVVLLENNPLFNAGRGSALNTVGKVEMDASIMDGKSLKAGAVSMVHSVKNPIILARIVMQKTHHVFFSGYGALQIAKKEKVCLKPNSYFITEYQIEELKKCRKIDTLKKITKRIYGTVGAVGLDKKGNLAAATSTGGTSNCLPGRIGDSCVIGAGCYANNQFCAVSGTGEGEHLIRGLIAHTISMMIELKQMSLQQACNYVLQKRHHNIKHDIGVIAINPQGEIATTFNTKIMKRAWVDTNGKLHIEL